LVSVSINRANSAAVLPTVGVAMVRYRRREARFAGTGQYADLAVLSDDYLTVPVEQVGDLHSVLTMVSGKAVYGEGPFAALEGK
jgi:hypothetical protein